MGLVPPHAGWNSYQLLSSLVLITKIERGPFIHNGPEIYDEALQEDRRHIPGQKEEKRLEKEVG